jgi:hypothetical protein
VVFPAFPREASFARVRHISVRVGLSFVTR